jgi:hypothetical protein
VVVGGSTVVLVGGGSGCVLDGGSVVDGSVNGDGAVVVVVGALDDVDGTVVGDVVEGGTNGDVVLVVVAAVLAVLVVVVGEPVVLVEGDAPAGRAVTTSSVPLRTTAAVSPAPVLRPSRPMA